MQSFIELAKKRRSTRVYDPRPIDRKDLDTCVEAALLSPSACNSQPWKFIIIDDASLKESISSRVITGRYSMNTFASGAAAFIAVVAEPVKLPSWVGGKLRGTDFQKIDLGIACENLCLEAEDLGIGTCMLGWFNERRLKKMLKVPRSRKIELLISLGYPTPREVPNRRLKEREEVLSHNKY
ncbi:MAG: nitroreductase family protein [Candidatus Tantalella remota]|nr:nitroreductase family protein [Candidatus Tantalella remota]